MKAAIPFLTFVMRHFLIVVLAAFVGCVLWTIGYFLLLLVAVIWNQGVGGPLAYPSGIILIIACCVFLGWGVFAPASGIGAIFCTMFRLPRLVAIPVVFTSAFLLSYLLYWIYFERFTPHSMDSVGIVLQNFAVFISVPLGIYWWLTEGSGAVFEVFLRWWKNRRAKIRKSE